MTTYRYVDQLFLKITSPWFSNEDKNTDESVINKKSCTYFLVKIESSE